jgi:NAD(P)-dependent dehydrogenase (short-subunit alcohol dehydrogenase family)
VDLTVKEFGRLDVAYNNAGIFDPIGITDALDVETWNKVISTNLSGVFYGVKYQVPVMLAQGGGAIINAGSVASVVGFQGIPAYTAAKHGVVGLTKVAALDYATKGIRVNAILPGVIDTPMMDVFSGGTDEGRAQMASLEPVGRMGTPAEMAEVVLWLGSDAASFVTGHALAADGGFTIR